MAPAQNRQSALFVPAAMLVACMWLCAPSSFVNSGIYATPPQSRISMRGFSEEFKEWESKLIKDDPALVLNPAAGQVLSDNSPPEEKVESFNNILQKFFESEKEVEALLQDGADDASSVLPDLEDGPGYLSLHLLRQVKREYETATDNYHVALRAEDMERLRFFLLSHIP
eukprot:TRINITY_DN2095_c0_g1_i1.p1 TRINITY_DN2095_c0_g1~~TRINITY_DN2095_c0_g1_i1.p1  ORF type:complete len:170 (+),score=39.48 TRINITY_DN2095_c0_g1_i1:201-710(+)